MVRASLPRFKKKCKSCRKYALIKGAWNYCMECYEKAYGRYEGKDRHLYVKQDGKG